MPIVRPRFRVPAEPAQAPASGLPADGHQRQGRKEQVHAGRRLPGVQLLLDDPALRLAEDALGIVESEVSVIHLGPALLMCEGLRAVREFREGHPERIIGADVRIWGRGAELARHCFRSGANWVTCASGASLSTIAGVVGAAEALGGHVRIELGERFSTDRARAWQMRGVSHVILPCPGQGRAERLPGQRCETLERMERLQQLGLAVSVAGAFAPEDVAVLIRAGAETVIVGESVTQAEDPLRAVTAVKVAIERAWI